MKAAGRAGRKPQLSAPQLQTVERALRAGPAYAPELNPVEQVWGNVKTRKLATVCAPDLHALRRPLHAGFGRVRHGE